MPRRVHRHAFHLLFPIVSWRSGPTRKMRIVTPRRRRADAQVRGRAGPVALEREGGLERVRLLLPSACGGVALLLVLLVLRFGAPCGCGDLLPGRRGGDDEDTIVAARPARVEVMRVVAMRPPSKRAQTAHSRRPNVPLIAAGAGLSTAREPCYNQGEVLEFRILGPLEVLDGEQPVPLGGRNQRALLTLLLLHANEAVSTERLVDQLWGEHPPRTATTSLQNTVVAAAEAARTRAPAHAADRVPARARRRPARPRPLRAARPRGARRRGPRPGAAAPRGARALARRPSGRHGAGELRPGGDPSARGSAARRARGADRRRPRGRGRRELVAEIESLVASIRSASGCGRS